MRFPRFFLFSLADFRTGGEVGEPRERGEIAKGALPLCPSESACTFDGDRSEAEIAVKGTMAYFRHESKIGANTISASKKENDYG